MNGNPYTANWIGATGEYPIYEKIKEVGSNSSNFTILNSNILETHLINKSNILQTQITATSNLIHKDNNSNTIVRISAKNPFYPAYGDPVEMLFQNVDGDCLTKINQDGELMVYHPPAPLPAGFSPGWWGVENKIANVITDTQGLRFDVTNLQAATGATAITNTSTATAAAAGAAAGAASAAATTAAAGATIAAGDYGSVALGVAGGALFTVLGYLSYQAQVKSNLNSNGFTAEAEQVQSNIITANGLIADNIGNIITGKGFVHSNMLFAQNYINSNTVSNLYVSCNVLCNLAISRGFINSNITTQQYISNLKCDNLYLNNGNITNINGISVNEITATGKIKQNNQFLDNTYLTSNHIYNLAYNYSSEREYPPKQFTSKTTEETTTLLGKLVYKETLFLDTTSISYGSGFYEIYSSSTYDINTPKSKLFNHDTADAINARWFMNQYNSGTGTYYGDWVIIKLPQQIMLTKFRFYTGGTTQRSPAEWKCYGSNDGITFTEIIQGSQLIPINSSSYSLGYYEKILASTQYQYIGFVVNKIVSTSGNTDLCFGEIKLYGKEIISNTINSNIYATSNAVKEIIIYDTPRVVKHNAFYCSTTTSFYPNGGTDLYYKYDLDLRNWTRTGYIDIGSGANDPYRIFRIRCFYGSCYFNVRNSGMPDILHYEVYMSNKAAAGGSGTVAGLQVYAVGVPESASLNSILPNNLFILRNDVNNFNYISIVSRQIADIRCIIEDLIS